MPVPPVKFAWTNCQVIAFQRTFFPPDLEFDLVHLSEPAFCHLSPVSLKVILPEARELPHGFANRIHERVQLPDDANDV